MCAIRRYLVYCLFICYVFIHYVSGLRNGYTPCRQSDTCITLVRCAPIMNLIRILEKPLRPAAHLFLRRQECGFDGVYPMVCCFSTNQRRTSVNKLYLEEKESTTEQQSQYPIYQNQNQYYRPPLTPDFSKLQLNDFRTVRAKSTVAPPRYTPNFNNNLIKDDYVVPSFDNNIKLTTERPRTKDTKKPFRPAAPTKSLSQMKQEKREKTMQKKMEEFNRAMMYSNLDYFFLRRMFDTVDNATEKNNIYMDLDESIDVK